MESLPREVGEVSDEQLREWYGRRAQALTEAPCVAPDDADPSPPDVALPEPPGVPVLRAAYASWSWGAHSGADVRGVEHWLVHLAGLAHLADPSRPPSDEPEGVSLSDQELREWYQATVVDPQDDDGETVPSPNVPPSDEPSLDELREAYAWCEATRAEEAEQGGGHVTGQSLLHRLRHKLGWQHS